MQALTEAQCTAASSMQAAAQHVDAQASQLELLELAASLRRDTDAFMAATKVRHPARRVPAGVMVVYCERHAGISVAFYNINHIVQVITFF